MDDNVTCQRILIAEDDEIMRQVLMTALTRAGFEAIATADGEQAWEIVSRGACDLLITDNEMPRLSGTELVERIRRNGIQLPIVIASGSFLRESGGGNSGYQVTAILRKPFRIEELLDVVTFALQRRDGAANASRVVYRRQAGRQRIFNWDQDPIL